MGACKSKSSVIDSNKDSSSSKLASFRSKDKGKSLDVSTHGKKQDPMDISTHSVGGRRNKDLLHSTSVLGLDKLIDDRREEGDLRNNIVHIEVPFGKPIEEVYDGVHDGKILGSGISGTVRLCSHKSTGIKYAVKCLDLDQIESDEGLQQLRDEIGIMCQLDHPNIIRLEEVYESYNEIYLVQELCTGGELFDRLDEQPDYHYTEAQCARLVKQMLSSVRYLHSKGIVHRDLKLENFLFSNPNSASELKLIDFGLSKHFKYGDIHHEAVGTPYTVAPEVIKGSYDERCDMWAIGVITYLLLSGEPPFGGCGGPEPLHQVRASILRANYKFAPVEIWDHVSDEAKSFISSLLVIDPKKRLSAKDCQQSTWLQDWSEKDQAQDHILSPNVVKALVNFKEYSDMRKLLCEVLSFTLLPEQITELRREFEKLDTEGTGEISLSGLKEVLLQGAGTGSLGAFTESEIEDIFNAIRVRTSDSTRIHWHEFLAAGISQCEIDGRNLRLAFDRLDSDHKGYITFDDIMVLMGRDGQGKEETMRATWGDTMTACNANDARVTYDEFVLLMKGQSTEEKKTHRRLSDKKEAKGTPTASSKLATPQSRELSEIVVIETVSGDDTPLSDRNKATQESKISGSFSDHLDNISDGYGPPERKRSYSVDLTLSPKSRQDDMENGSKVEAQSLIGALAQFAPDLRRAVQIPEHTHSQEDIESLIKDETKTPLVVNRQLYRIHRQMRHSVLEASKRLEEEKLRRTHEELQKKQRVAGLVMRHRQGTEISPESALDLMKQRDLDQQKLVDSANQRAGRKRIKTKSDMSGMMLSNSTLAVSPMTKSGLVATISEDDAE